MPELLSNPSPPTTRYQGSKRKLLDFIWENVRGLEFDSVLDIFGGTASVAYRLKSEGKAVTVNDNLRANHWNARAIVENDSVTLEDAALDELLRPEPGAEYDGFIARTFSGVYFTDEENAWLDMVCQNIRRMESQWARAVAWRALFQACLVKRPYNLFHRRNLYMRTADVRRGFGNKSTWDTPFDVHFRRFAAETNAAVFHSGRPCRAICGDALEVPAGQDLVYIDPPYVNSRGVGVDYFRFYHFLEGLADYPNWPLRLDRGKKHLPLAGSQSPFSDPKRNAEALDRIFARHADSILVVSYRSDGIPDEATLAGLIRRYKPRVRVTGAARYRYALSTNRRSRELLFIGQ